ncbi:hypothetical protein BDP81DRAFT_515608 [Colletotrichum phormii]|uniref:PA14 domain-containing protein n=1 Tax=Colletotrichum phormii TaxID=359342 RepID=A0AAI9ZTQ9_9PEZI|nr:uncharacterized protein BDP81DRAFT_515608 [Colletotrichum phormii]KAK1638045.1 hypothetical protein BDP81DRAFT_515608 [Colletotrichum phormii]
MTPRSILSLSFLPQRILASVSSFDHEGDLPATWCFTYLSTYLEPTTITAGPTGLETTPNSTSSADAPLSTETNINLSTNPTFGVSGTPTFSLDTSLSATGLSASRSAQQTATTATTPLTIPTSSLDPSSFSAAGSDTSSIPLTTSSPASLTSNRQVPITATSSGPFTLTSAQVDQPVILFVASEKRMPGGFVNQNISADRQKCDTATAFSLVAGELLDSGVPVHYSPGEIYKPLNAMGTPQNNAITTTFDVFEGVLRFYHPSLPSTQAGFCQDATGQVHVTFTSRPPDYDPVSLLAYGASWLVQSGYRDIDCTKCKFDGSLQHHESFHRNYAERVTSRLFYIIGHDSPSYFAIDTIIIVTDPVPFVVLVAFAVLIALVVALAVFKNDLAHPDFCNGRIKIFHLDALLQFYKIETSSFSASMSDTSSSTSLTTSLSSTSSITTPSLPTTTSSSFLSSSSSSSSSASTSSSSTTSTSAAPSCLPGSEFAAYVFDRLSAPCQELLRVLGDGSKNPRNLNLTLLTQGQTPLGSGITPFISYTNSPIQANNPANIYRVRGPSGTTWSNSCEVIQQRGYLNFNQATIFTITIDVPDDYMFVWLDASASSGVPYVAGSSQLVSDTFMRQSRTSYKLVVTETQRYVPFRVWFANSGGPCHFNMLLPAVVRLPLVVVSFLYSFEP